ncbi:MAG: NfeD family protein [Prevotellaceae bacterium]|jgi:membrane protein implicated in regulation of membrane protease activity|nr:NfeD family protein [Prevotellaceae bacterium]
MDILSTWHVWMIAAVVFFILEMFTPSFFMACLGIGCVAGGLAALFSDSTIVQLLLFSLATIAAFVGMRPLMLRYVYNKKTLAVRTNVDNLIGRTARVSERIDPATGQGRVVVDGDDWKAISATGAPIDKGEQVEILNVESVVVTVRDLKI